MRRGLQYLHKCYYFNANRNNLASLTCNYLHTDPIKLTSNQTIKATRFSFGIKAILELTKESQCYSIQCSTHFLTINYSRNRIDNKWRYIIRVLGTLYSMELSYNCAEDSRVLSIIEYKNYGQTRFASLGMPYRPLGTPQEELQSITDEGYYDWLIFAIRKQQKQYQYIDQEAYKIIQDIIL